MAVYRRGRRWYYDILIDGKRVKRSTDAADKLGAQIEAEIAKRKVTAPAPAATPAGAELLLHDAIMRCYNEEWQHSKSGLKMVNRTLKIVDILGNIPLEAVNEAQIAKMVDSLEKKKLSQSSINRYRAYLRRVLNLAQKKWLVLGRVPYIRNTKEVPKRFKVYTPDEEKLILSMPNHELVDLATVLFDTGMRLSEALRLTKEEVDFDSNTIMVWADATKGGKSRGIPMTRRVCALLQHRTLPFTFKDGDEVERIWRRFRKGHKLTGDGWVIHTMRHTFASRLVRKGIDLYTVKELLGHSTITVTERYAHLNPQKLVHAMSVLESS